MHDTSNIFIKLFEIIVQLGDGYYQCIIFTNLHDD